MPDSSLTPLPLSTHARPTARWHEILLLCIFGAILFLPFLGLRDLWSAGEGRVAQVARQMVDSGDWVVPRLGNNVRMKKPPMAYWLTAIASLPGGDVTAFSSRLPNALAGIGVMLLVYLFGLQFFTRCTALLGAMLLGTTSECWQQARMTGIEMPLLFFSLLGFYGWWRYHAAADADPAAPKSRRRPLGWLILCYLAFALSALEKAHVGPALFAIIALVYVTVTGNWRRTTVRQFLAHHALGFGLFLIVALSWVALVLQSIAAESSTASAWDAIGIWYDESSGRFGRSSGERPTVIDHPEPWYYFFRIAFLEGQPWVLFGLMGLLLPLGASKRSQRGMILLAIWVGVTLLYFSIPGSKKSYYILPIYPAIALLGARFLTAFVSRELSPMLNRCVRSLLLFMGGVPVVIAFIFWPIWWLWLRDNPKLSLLTESLGFIAAVLFFMAGVGVMLIGYLRRGMPRRAVYCAIFLIVSIYAGIIASYPQQNRHKGKRLVSSHLVPQLKTEDRVFTYEISGSSIFSFYLDHPVERLLETHNITSQLRYRNIDAATTRVFILLREKELPTLRDPVDRVRLIPNDHPVDEKGYRWYQYRLNK